MITQGKQLPEDSGHLESETEDDDNNDDKADILKEDVLNRTSLVKRIIEHGGNVLTKFPDKDKEKVPLNVSLPNY